MIAPLGCLKVESLKDVDMLAMSKRIDISAASLGLYVRVTGHPSGGINKQVALCCEMMAHAVKIILPQAGTSQDTRHLDRRRKNIGCRPAVL